MRMPLTPDSPTSTISSVSMEVINNFVRCYLHGRSWTLSNHWGRGRIMMLTFSMVVECCSMQASGDQYMWWIAKRLRHLTGNVYHSLQLWLISIRLEYCGKIFVEYLPCNANLGLSWRWGRFLIGCYSFHIFIFTLGIRGWDVWPVKCHPKPGRPQELI